MDEVFWEVHSGLPQEGPGSDEATAQALTLIRGLPAQPKILDIGCGPGRQTMVLTRMTGGHVTALDTHSPFLDELNRRARDNGVEGQVTTVNRSMTSMAFEPESFDLVWSEGAIYIMGFEDGLRAVWPLLRRGGALAVTEISWFTDKPSAELKAFWGEAYPPMTAVPNNLSTIEKSGYKLIDHFPLPDSAWLDGYYGPLEERVAQLRRKYAGQRDKLACLDMEVLEIEMFRKYSAEYGYVFYIMRKPPA